MNCFTNSSLTNVTTTEASTPLFSSILLDKLTDIIGLYLITAISVIGVFLNMFFYGLLQKPELNTNYYKHLRIKSLIDLIACFIGTGYLKSIYLNCDDTRFSSFSWNVYKWFVVVSITRMIMMTSSFHEIFLVFNRYRILTSETSRSVDVNLTVYTVFIFLIPAILYIPYFFTIELQSQIPGVYYPVSTNFGKNILIFFHR